MRNISKLHYITTSALLAEQACSAGVNWVQLRLKNFSFSDYKKVAKEVKAVCRQYNATFIINDNVPLAMEIDADGVHLGKQDMPIRAARALVGNNFIIGGTANTYEDIVRLTAEKVSYIGLGPFRFTTTKENLSPIIGLEGYKNLFCQLLSGGIQPPPVIGIGGITLDDIDSLLQTGLHGIAISKAISEAEDIKATASIFVKKVQEYTFQTQLKHGTTHYSG